MAQGAYFEKDWGDAFLLIMWGSGAPNKALIILELYWPVVKKFVYMEKFKRVAYGCIFCDGNCNICLNLNGLKLH